MAYLLKFNTIGSNSKTRGLQINNDEISVKRRNRDLP